MHRHDEVEYILDGLQKMLPVINLNIEFILDRVMHQHASLDAEVVILVIPVRLECDWDTVPTVRVDVTQTVTAHLDDAFGHDVWLLVQVDVVLVWVVEGAHGAHGCDLLHPHLLGHLLEDLKEHGN